MELLEELSGHKVTSRTSYNVTCFFGELNLLSNFHRCSFNSNGYTFSSSEQFIQYTKCRYFDNNKLAERILKTDDAFQCKSLAREVRYSNDKERWLDVAKDLCLPRIRSKFEQNENVKQFLPHTGKQTLVEGAYDRLWESGIPIHHKDCLNPSMWNSQGLLGEILCQVHAELSDASAISSCNDGTLV